jgi:hypothetical protein
MVWRAPERVAPAIAWGLVLASLAASLIGLAGYFNLVPHAQDYARYGRATGFFKDPNVFGPSLVFPALYLVHRLITRRFLEAVVTLPVLMVILAALFLSFSRGAWMNFLVAAGIFFVASYIVAQPRERGRIIGFLLALGLMTTSAIAWALSLDAVRKLFVQRFALSQNYDAAEGGRYDNMLDAFRTALGHPWGIGPDQWPYFYSTTHLMPHDIYVNVFVSGGFLSLLGFLLLGFSTLWVGFRAFRRNPPQSAVLIIATGVFAGHALEGFIIDSNHWRHLYVVMGIIWGLALAGESRTRNAVADAGLPKPPNSPFLRG